MKKWHIFDYLKLKIEYDTLKETMKEDIFKKIVDKTGEPLEIARLRKENKKLRLKVKALQEIIRNGE